MAQVSYTNKYTENEHAIVRKMLTDGCSFRMIAKEIGRTKGAIASYASRYGFSTPYQRPSKQWAPKKNQTKKVVQVKQIPVDETLVLHRIRAKLLIPIKLDEPVDDAGMTLLELKHDSCRWPFGDPCFSTFRFCGKTSKEGSPYCAAHHKKAHVAAFKCYD